MQELQNTLDETVERYRLAKRSAFQEAFVVQSGSRLDESLTVDLEDAPSVLSGSDLHTETFLETSEDSLADLEHYFTSLPSPDFDPEAWTTVLAKSTTAQTADTNAVEYYIRIFKFENDQLMKSALVEYLNRHLGDYHWVVLGLITLGVERKEIIDLLETALRIDADALCRYLTAGRYERLSYRFRCDRPTTSSPRNMFYLGMTIGSTGQGRHEQDHNRKHRQSRVMHWSHLPQVPRPSVYRFIGVKTSLPIDSLSVRTIPILGRVERYLIKSIPPGLRLNSAEGGWRVHWQLGDSLSAVHARVASECSGLREASNNLEDRDIEDKTVRLEASIRQAATYFSDRGCLHPNLSNARRVIEERTNCSTYNGLVVRAQIMRERPEEAHREFCGVNYSGTTGRSFASWRSLMAVFHPELRRFETPERIEDIPRLMFAGIFGVVLDIWALVSLEVQTRICLLVLWREILILQPLFVSHWGAIPAGLLVRQEVFLAFNNSIPDSQWLRRFLDCDIPLDDADRDLVNHNSTNRHVNTAMIQNKPLTHSDMMQAIGEIMVIPYGPDLAYLGTFSPDLGAAKYRPELAKERAAIDFLCELQNQVIVRVLKDFLYAFKRSAFPGTESLVICRTRAMDICRRSGLTAALDDAKSIYSARSKIHHGLYMRSRHQRARKDVPTSDFQDTDDEGAMSSSEDTWSYDKSWEVSPGGKSPRAHHDVGVDHPENAADSSINDRKHKVEEGQKNYAGLQMRGSPNSQERHDQLDELNAYYIDRQARGMRPLDRYKLSGDDLSLDPTTGAIGDLLRTWLAKLAPGTQPYQALNGRGRTPLGREIATLCRAKGTAQINSPAALLVRYRNANAIERNDTISCIRELAELANPARLRESVSNMDVTMGWRAVRCQSCDLVIIRHVNPRHSHFCPSLARWVMLTPENFPAMVQLDLVHDLATWLALQEDPELDREFAVAATGLDARRCDEILQDKQISRLLPEHLELPRDMVYAQPKSAADVWTTLAIHMALQRWEGSATNASLKPKDASALQAQTKFSKAIVKHFTVSTDVLPKSQMGRKDPAKTGPRKGRYLQRRDHLAATDSRFRSRFFRRVAAIQACDLR
jgi:hypothetical protein